MAQTITALQLAGAIVLTGISIVAKAETVSAPGEGRVQGGLCVVVGAGDGALATALAGRTSMVVNVLEADAAKVAAVRQSLMAAKLYGKASVEQWAEPTLPYADNLVSLLVVAEAGKIPEREMLRVLRPYGELYVQQAGAWKRAVKPLPAGMDEWTHWRHGVDGNPVSKDQFIDLSERVQYIFGRDIVDERTYAVFASGRMFAVDSGNVVARDAFNGMLLWKKRADVGIGKDLEPLGYHNLGKLVAVGDRVYFSTPDGKFKAHDAATEKLLMTYEEAGTPLGILCVQDGSSELGTLVLNDKDSIRALDAKTGTLLWKFPGSLVKHVVADNATVYYVNGDFFKKEKVAVVARSLKTGKVVWEKTDFKDPCPWPERAVSSSLGYGMLAYALKVPYRWPGGWRKYYEENPDEKKKGIGVVIISAKTGETIQETRSGGASARHGEWNDAVWVNGSLLRTCNERGMGSAITMNSISNLAGAPVVFDDNNVGDRGFGHCYPPTVTEKYYIYGQLNFVDLKTHECKANQITRAGCCNANKPAYLPANGMIYVHQKHCVCFPMLDGNSALASAYAEAPKESNPLVQGPAWGAKAVKADYSKEWPVYRHDSYRSAGTAAAVAKPSKVLWTAEIAQPNYLDAMAAEWPTHQYVPGKVTQPTIAGGVVYVAQPDTHRVVALDAATGKQKWEFFANGRVDTPPTIYDGMCLIGCRSGWLFNLRASDGALIWKLRLAPYDRRISMFGQVESPSPVPGSVAVIDGLAYTAAGLHPQADGGVRVFCIEPATGKIVWQNKYTTLGYEDRKWGAYTLPMNEDPWRRMGVKEYEPVDLPVKDGDAVAVSRWRFDLKTGKATLNKTSGFYYVNETGTYMRRRASSYGARSPQHRTPLTAFLGSSVYTDTLGNPRLFRVDFEKGKPFDPNWLNSKEAGMASSASRLLELGAKWKVGAAQGSKDFAQAMVVAGDTLYVVTRGNKLEAYSTQDGQKTGEMAVEAAVWDGLAAANGKLYLATAEGKILCIGQ